MFAAVGFDLGETLVDTRTYNFERIFYKPGSFEYLKELQRRNYPLGLIVNVPDEWGATREAKLATLLEFVRKRWTDLRPFELSMFSRNLVLVPPRDGQRKPDPFLFLEAAGIAAKAGCPAVYQGEDPLEVQVASRNGLRGFQVGNPAEPFLAIDRIDAN